MSSSIDRTALRAANDVPRGTLGDRAQLLLRLNEVMPNADTGARLVALLVIDVRTGASALTKTQYDGHGRLLREVEKRLQSVVRPNDLLAKVGWERFGIVLFPIKGEGHALLAANKFLAVLNELATTDRTRRFDFDPRIGAALFPSHGHDAEHLLRLAERACDRANGEESGISVYQPGGGALGADDPSLLSDFRNAIEANAIELYYQPKIELASGRCVGAEALLRWERAPGVFVPPPVMIPLAERYGAASLLTSRVLKTALRGWTEFKARGIDIAISVNLCASDVVDPELPDLVRQGLAAWGVPPERVTLEVTEGSLITNAALALTHLQRLRELGCRISIDDFGTGYSSFAYLKKLPVDELKIDQLFIRNLLADPREAMIVRAIVDLAHNLGFTVVAEGVGDTETVRALRSLGCEMIQGYLASKPVKQAEFLEWFQAWNPAGFA